MSNPRITMELEGCDAVIAVLRQLPPNVAGKLVKPAMNEAGRMLKEHTRYKAYQQLQGAQQRGYKRKTGAHLFETAAARAKTYRKGNTTFVAVGFNYKAGGSHAHLVEFGHEIVKGGTLKKGDKAAGMTAAGKRALFAAGWDKGDWEGTRIALKGCHKGKKVKQILRGAWKYAFTGEVSRHLTGKFAKYRGGGKIVGGGQGEGGKTRAYPILGPAFDVMKRPMMIAIELELKKIDAEAVRLAKNPQKRKWLDFKVI